MTMKSHIEALRIGGSLRPQPRSLGTLGNRRVYKDEEPSAFLLLIPPTCISNRNTQLSSYLLVASQLVLIAYSLVLIAYRTLLVAHSNLLAV